MSATPKETMPLVAASEDCFTCDPELLFDQACNVEMHCLGEWIGGSKDLFLLFFRRCLIIAPEGFECNSRGMCYGIEMVAYRCTERGEVENWNRRYETQGVDAGRALSKLRFQLANGLVQLSHSEPARDMTDFGMSAFPTDLGL